jgi:lia operon protein LiaF|tara:strand:- start:400 stop:579 length:180 start_codon:yes stop_codon:yes gene_type:complete
MKKGKSIGILFIIIGLLFLLNNLNLIKVSVVEIIRVYWPVILIWIGIDKLISKPTEKVS